MLLAHVHVALQVVAGGQVSAAVMRAFTAVSGGDAAAAEAAVACRCAELLHAMATYGRGPYSDGDDSSGDEDVTATVAAAAVGPQRRGLLADLAALAADAEPRLADHAGEGGHGAERGVLEGPAGYWAQQLAGYHQVRRGSRWVVLVGVVLAKLVRSSGLLAPKCAAPRQSFLLRERPGPLEAVLHR